ncbi:diguanylate cyclase (GGDEF)-like protein [Actimicrobium sp. GrIS 1.19]|uniref:bifunctional diguanylate cyclase/phosphodiesterase n=1 Tax=Actimicrobium sp. GrIS 1.19 TaxID=3071708 RepID=UPI002DFF44C5|nr:diguanylate cyclase (GGDEF)-like protein [Actimicrobium sp. GrIS 1.19]
MRFRSLESRIVTLFLLLILAVQLAGFVAIRTGIKQNARAEVNNELVIGERVFRRLLEQNAQNLTTGARVLALDYGFRQAIGTNDTETIASVLANHGARIGASFAMLVSPDRLIKATTVSNTGASLQASILPLVAAAETSGSATGIRLIDKHPYQIVVVPVKAPLVIGWVAMAFPINQDIVSDMRDLSALQVAILSRRKNEHWTTEASSLSKAEADSLGAQLHQMPHAISAIETLNLETNEFGSRSLALADDGEQTTIVVLLRSISEAIAPYEHLQFTLLMLTAGCTLLAGIGSIFTARRITGPLRDLTETARRLGNGEYEGRLEIRRNDEIGALSRAFESMRDGIVRREAEIGRVAYWDTLTNLPNRLQFVKMTSAAIEQATRTGATCYILMMNLDRFKNVNDVLGHAFGDAVLRLVASQLREHLAGSANQVARIGGDEFAIILPMADLRDAREVAERILKAMEQPISLDDQTIDLGVGIGIAGYPANGSDAESLLSRAEMAMYAAKKSGSEAVLYDPSIDKASDASLSLLSELRRAIENNEFRLQVQPKIMLGSGAVIGLEALIRWVHPERGMVFPDNFIPFAEKTGYIRVMTRWVLEQSALLCSQWLERGVHLKISVNLSTRDLLDQDLPRKFADILQRHGVTPVSFCLEITESAIMDDPVRALQTLDRLHAMGVELSIDDFGTGYSSLAYLKRLPVDELKIDKSFVMNMQNDADDAQIVRSTIDLGHNMGLRVVAEGIESEDVWNLLAGMGCDQGQGYFISKPMPAEQLVDWIDRWVAPQHALAQPDVSAHHG